MLNRRSFLLQTGGITASAAALSLTRFPSIAAADAGPNPNLQVPSWLITDLGPLGVPYSRVEDFAIPPASSYGILFSEDRLTKGYHVEELAGGVYWVTTGAYDCMFISTGAGVIAVDAPPSLGENLLSAIEEMTDEPVTHMIYSHWHADHVGAAAMFGDKITRIGHAKTRELLERFPDPHRPPPNEIFSQDSTLDVNGVKVEMSYKGQNHSEGLIFVYVPGPKILAAIDIASPGWSTFRSCDMSENMSGYIQAYDQVLSYDFAQVVSGHVSRLGGRAAVEEGREFLQDLLTFAHEALLTIEFGYFIKQLQGPYRASYRWAEASYFDACTNWVVKKMLEKTTSNGKTWPERLNGVDVLMKDNAFFVIEKMRMEMSHNGYVMRGNVKPPGYFF
ncbi:MAG TPA: MBL fold metallo-hydrolase [Phycisphaerae bacterium]|nr:MBL fold metallo-hydrolase [Phycisphaerae bacterium]